MTRHRQPQLARRGFTLIELLIVVLLLAILGGLLFSVSSGVFQKGDRSRAVSELQAISVALEAFRGRFGDYPEVDSAGDLFDALDGKLGPRGDKLDPQFPPFLEAGRFSLGDDENPELLDPWGKPYIYSSYLIPDTQTRQSGYSLYSNGPDGKSVNDGEGDDPVNADNLRYDD